MSNSGLVKSFNDSKGWGFITCEQVEGDIFLHVKDCADGRPTAGDRVVFDLQEDAKRPGQQNAVNVSGCSKHGWHGSNQMDGKGKGRLATNPDSCRGFVKSFNDTKGWGFIDKDGVDIFLHVKDCLDGRPQVGDMLSFELDNDAVRGEGQLMAKNVSGCTGKGCGKGFAMKGKGKGLDIMFSQMVSGANMAGKGKSFGGGFGGMCGGGFGGMKGGDPYGGMKGGWKGGDAYGGGWDSGFAAGGGAAGGGWDSGFAAGMAAAAAKGGAPKGGGKSSSGQPQGTVKSFNDSKGWGFIVYNGTEVFLHVKDCKDGRPQAGDWVSFDTEEDGARAGQLKALNVTGCSGAFREDGKGAAKGAFGAVQQFFGGGKKGGPYGGGYGKGKW